MLPTDIKTYYTQGGGASDGGAAGTVPNSYGGYRSTTEMVDNTEQNLIPAVTATEASAGGAKYPCICYRNTHATEDFANPKVYIPTLPGGDVITGFDWSASASGTGEFYLELSGGGAPSIDNQLLTSPLNTIINGAYATAGTLGSLNAGEYAWGDNDSLGFSTLYVRLSDDSNPNTQLANYVKHSDIDIQIGFTAPEYGTSAAPLSADIDTAPSGVTFQTASGHATYADGISPVATMAPDDNLFIHFKITYEANATRVNTTLANNALTFAIDGEA